mgnify:CR=1 FL=1
MTEVIKSDLINEISNNLNSISLEQFSKDQLEKIAKLLYLDKAKEKLNNEANKVKFNYEEVKETWLKEFRAKNTKLIYKKSLSIFKNYLEEKGLHILDVKAKDIDGFITVLNNIEELSNSTKRLYITAVSSFFSKLQRWEHIDFNYFKGSKLPKKERSRELKVPSSQDVETIRKTLLGYLEYKGRGSNNIKKSVEKNIIVFDLLVETGLRIGAVKTIKVGQDNTISGISKNKRFKIKISEELTKKLRKLDLSKITENSIQIFIKTACKRAELKLYNAHSFRHYFAVKDYRENKDIYRVKELLNHSSISITENYLKSLNVI